MAKKKDTYLTKAEDMPKAKSKEYKEVKGLTDVQIQEIKAQVADEIQFARTYKQGKITNWQRNEQMYYAKKQPAQDNRANVDLAKMQEFVHTLLSKIDNPLTFKYTKRKEAQLKRVELLNALKTIDASKNDWDIKDLVGKKQGIIYGRAIYFYYADSVNGRYKAHLENTDVYDFLIDPSAGGLDIEQAMYLGRYGVILSRKQLEEGDYIKSSVKNILLGEGNNTETTQEEENKSERMYGQKTIGKKELQHKDKFKFWEWFTTYEGIRYKVITQDSGECIEIKPLAEIFTPNEEFELGAWPVWTWAAFPDLTEFWTPSYCDYAREIFLAQNESINQMLDNGTKINEPMKAVNINAIENPNEVKWKRNGIIKVKNDIDINKAVQILQQAPISTAIQVYQVLEAIQEKASGVTAGAKGVADEEGKVGIYEGNQQATSDRFGLLNKSYAFGYKRFAKLYELGVKDNLTKEMAVDIVGPNGIEVRTVTSKDIFKEGDDFGVIVEASNAEEMAGMVKNNQKIIFLRGQVNNQTINQKKRFELEAKASGITEEEITQMLDVSEFGNQELMSEAERDIESILEGEKIKPNMNANNAYKQRVVDYMKDHSEDMSKEQFEAMVAYARSLDQVIYGNEARALNTHMVNTLNKPGVVAGGTAMTGNNINPASQIDESTIQDQEEV